MDTQTHQLLLNVAAAGLPFAMVLLILWRGTPSENTLLVEEIVRGEE